MSSQLVQARDGYAAVPTTPRQDLNSEDSIYTAITFSGPPPKAPRQPVTAVPQSGFPKQSSPEKPFKVLHTRLSLQLSVGPQTTA